MSGSESSRRDEINAFAAMATGGLERRTSSVSSTNDGQTETGNSNNTNTNTNTGTFDFSAAIRVDGSSSNNNASDGDPFLKQLRQSGTPASPSEDSIVGNSTTAASALEEDSIRRTFMQAGQRIENSGTFSRLSTRPNNNTGSLRSISSGSVQRNQNLEAAALALADPSDDDPPHRGNSPLASSSAKHAQYPSSHSSSFGSSNKSQYHSPSHLGGTNNANFLQFPCGAAMNQTPQGGSIPGDGTAMGNDNNAPLFGQIPAHKTPMHAQEVRLERPLFFGPYLPPRVLEEATKIVEDALTEQWEKHQTSSTSSKEFTPRVGQLPPGVRNLVSAIQCYGFGLDIVPKTRSSSSSSSTSESTGTSSPYISVFCPRWSEDRKKSHSPPTVPLTSSAEEAVVASSRENAQRQGTQGTNTTTTRQTSSTSSGFSSADSSAGQPPEQGETGESSAVDTSRSERDMFSAFALGGGSGDFSEGSDDSRILVESSQTTLGDGNSPSKLPPTPRTNVNANTNATNKSDADTKKIRSSSGKMDSGGDTPTGKKPPRTPKQLSEQAQFTQWVHGGDSPANVVTSSSNSKSGGGTFQFNDSFRGAVAAGGADDSDDDTVVGSEMKTKVGVNEHLNAALASLEDGQSPAENIIMETNATSEEGELTQVPLTKDGGRPLSNQELMNAHAPLFGVDDPPLPSESDLGNHETREEQQRSKEQRRIQAFIEKFCPHNIFGPLACPNPATSPDDNHSWNSLATPLQRNPSSLSPNGNSNDNPPGSTTTSPLGGRSVASDDLASLHSANGYGMTAKKVSQLASTPRGYDPRTRYGWWNTPNDNDADAAAKVSDLDELSVDNATQEASSSSSEAPIQLPPVEHPSNGFPIQTLLEPSPETLHKQNRPLSELHPATSLAQALPFISDRPPSYRYLQVNTQAVAFPALVEEVEPLFCSLAIYHVETIAHSLGDRGMAPIPDLERCGKVTETLNFDLIKNPEVEKHCFSALSPDDKTNKSSSHLTSCGVFPLPSNLSVNNLYAIITVGKVISEGSDFEPYLRAKSKGKDDQINIENLRQKAEKASINHGNFIMPFAFGVAPLLQVFGADVPRVPSSRAVQIPLFRFYAGNGERQIIDHIMVMLYPRADHRASGIGGPAPLTNGGTAMLVMRNFGYLGLHEVVNGKSSLAMDRLIDFTGEMQLRRRDEDENDAVKSKKTAHSGLPAWRSQYKAEPTVNGGRSTKSNTSRPERSYSTLNAQELAPVPLLTTPLGRPSTSPISVPKSRTRGHSSGEDIEPYFHTTFCNELLCYPRLLRNCQKGNIVVKVEMREVEWNPEYGVFLAHMPAFGPTVHNLRRGPFLVQGAYTSCSARRPDPHFLDEFKLKLPLLLGNNESRCTSMFFTVYRLSFSSRKKWGLRGLGKKRGTKKFDEITGDMVGESDVVTGKDCQLIQLGCGFLPLEKRNSLLENGNHDVKISYVAKYPLQEFCDKEGISSDTIVMSDFTIGKGDSVAGDESVHDDGESQGSERYHVDTLSATSASDRETVLSENMDDSKARQLRKQLGMLLQVRISVQSSIHSQNATLNEFLSQEPDVSVPLKAGGKDMVSFLRSGKDAIFRQLSVSSFRTPPENIQYETKKLLISTVDLAKPDMCSISDISLHLVRVCKQLWKIAVVGTGNHDLKWANPAATLPLRVNAFATLLQILGSATLFLSKRGVTQLDGNGKFNLLSLSRVMGLLFDEKDMFGDSYDEVFSSEYLSVLMGDERVQKSSSKRANRRHIRSNFEFGNGSDGVSAIIQDNSSETLSQLADVSTIQGPSSTEKKAEKSPMSAAELREKLTNDSKSPKMDTVHDFKNAMQTGNRENEYEDAIHEGQFSGNETAASWIVAFGGSSGGNNRRWMTAPAPGLSTIQEDTGYDEEQKYSDRKATKANQGPLDFLDKEMILSKDAAANGGKKRPVTQFRIPKRTTKQSPSNSNQSLDMLDKSKDPFVDSDQSLDQSAGVTLLYVPE